MEEQHLHHPLLSTAATTSNDDTLSSTTTSCIAQRLLIVIFVGVISIWANNEASKGFEIRVINDMKGTPVGDKFSLFFVSNDEATRLVQSATTFAAEVLYSKANSMPEKVDQVDVRLSRHSLTYNYAVVTKTSEQKNRYEISLSPVIKKFGDFRHRIRKEIRRGLAEVLLFDKRDRVPKMLINGLVEYMSNLEGLDGPNPVFRPRNSSSRCWEDNDPKVVARFLENCEGISEGFIGRLYQEMSNDDWDDYAVDKALGMITTPLCESLHKDFKSN